MFIASRQIPAKQPHDLADEAMIDYKQQHGFYRAEAKPKKSATATKATRGKKKATKKKG